MGMRNAVEHVSAVGRTRDPKMAVMARASAHLRSDRCDERVDIKSNGRGSVGEMVDGRN